MSPRRHARLRTHQHMRRTLRRIKRHLHYKVQEAIALGLPIRYDEEGYRRLQKVVFLALDECEALGL